MSGRDDTVLMVTPLDGGGSDGGGSLVAVTAM